MDTLILIVIATACTLAFIRKAEGTSGKDASGNDYEDVYPVSEKTWQTLASEGYNIE